MGKIFCLMGKSSCGKDTIFKEIITDESLGLKPIVTYTTRPIRVNETDGVEYNFISEDKLNYFRDLNKIIELRVYNTVYGPWYYGMIDDGQIDLDNSSYLVISTLEAYLSLIKYFGKDNIIPMYIDLDDGIRLERALNREKAQDNPNYKEMCRRFLADSEDFGEEKLKQCEIKTQYKNINLHECIDNIKKDIIKFIL